MEHFKENHKDTAVREFELYDRSRGECGVLVVNGELWMDYKILL